MCPWWSSVRVERAPGGNKGVWPWQSLQQVSDCLLVCLFACLLVCLFLLKLGSKWKNVKSLEQLGGALRVQVKGGAVASDGWAKRCVLHMCMCVSEGVKGLLVLAKETEVCSHLKWKIKITNIFVFFYYQIVLQWTLHSLQASICLSQGHTVLDGGASSPFAPYERLNTSKNEV